MYNEPDFELVGSPPPSSSRAGSSAGNAFVYTDRTSSHHYGQDKCSAYEKELFGAESGRGSAMSNRPPSGRYTNGYTNGYTNDSSKPPTTPKTPINNRTQTIKSKSTPGKKKKQYKATPSYADELLFGNTTPKPDDALWESTYNNRAGSQTPLSSDRSYKVKNYYTQNLNKSSRDRPPSRSETPSAFEQNGRSSRQEVTSRSRPATPVHSRPSTPASQAADRKAALLSRSPKKKHTNKHNASYVDEMLFGPKPEEASFKAPWDKEKTPRPQRFDYSDYRPQSQTPANRPPSGRPPSRPTSARPSSRQSVASSGRNSAMNGQVTNGDKKLFKQSYVDENLFGPKPVECDWDAPWEDPKDKYKKPLIYDSSNYKMTVEHGNIPKPQPRVKSSLHKSKSLSSSNLEKRPVWR